MRDEYWHLRRVVLVEENGTRVVLATHVSPERAQAIVDALRGVCTFKSVEIVAESVPALQSDSVLED